MSREWAWNKLDLEDRAVHMAAPKICRGVSCSLTGSARVEFRPTFPPVIRSSPDRCSLTNKELRWMDGGLRLHGWFLLSHFASLLYYYRHKWKEQTELFLPASTHMTRGRKKNARAECHHWERQYLAVKNFDFSVLLQSRRLCRYHVHLPAANSSVHINRGWRDHYLFAAWHKKTTKKKHWL